MPTTTKKPRKPKKARAAAVVAVASEETIVAFKGFDKDFQCRGFQFEVGKTYEHDGKVEACESGFHACEHPLHVWQYYKPSASRFARVTLGGKTSRHSGDTKIAAARITIDAEISISDLTAAAVKWVFSRAKWKEGSVAKEANEGATASGDSGAATASGDYGAATASGYYGAATASGYYGKARGEEGCALFLAERDSARRIINVWAGIVGKDGVKPDTFYTLRDGKPVEV